MAAYSIREGRLRGDCERRGWRLMKSRRGEEGDSGSGGFMIVDALTGTVLAGGKPRAFSMTIDEIRDYLAARSKGTRQRLMKTAAGHRAANDAVLPLHAANKAAACADDLLAAGEVEGCDVEANLGCDRATAGAGVGRGRSGALRQPMLNVD